MIRARTAGCAAAQGVAAAGVVGGSAAVRAHQVVGAVVQPAKGVGGAGGVELAGVVVDHVEPDLDPGRVHRPHQVAELVERVAGGVGLVGGEEVEGHVAPVVALVRVELLHREQLDHGDAEVLEVGNLRHQPGEGAALPGLTPERRGR